MSSIFRRLFYALSYLGKPPWDTGISPPELIEFINSHPAGSALDLGCGTGTNLKTLADNRWRVCGIELSRHAIKQAIRRLSQYGSDAKIIRGDVSGHVPIDERFDLILDIGCFHDLSQADRIGYRRNIDRWLKPGGTYMIYAHCLTPERPRATGVSPADIDAFSNFLIMEKLSDTTDRWDRKTVWITFKKSG